MSNINISLEELEYLLIKNKCEYLFGFPDAFIKIDRSEITKKFDRVADGLENQNLIKRSFKGETTYDKTIEKIIECIKSVDKYYDITIIDSNVVSKKYRIYENKEDYVVIEILGKGNSELDYSQMYIRIYDNTSLCDKANKLAEKLFKNCSQGNDKSIEIPSELYKKINKLTEEKFIDKYKDVSQEDLAALKVAHKTITYAEKILSVSMTDMKKKKSKVNMYVYGLKNLLAMEFEIKKEEYKWVTKQVDKSAFASEIKRIFG